MCWLLTRPFLRTPLLLLLSAIGTVNFTGDMPVILMVDGPSLGGFVCAATIVSTELWKIGQVRTRNHWLCLPEACKKAGNYSMARRCTNAQQLPKQALGSFPSPLSLSP
jgi:urea carboxylase